MGKRRPPRFDLWGGIECTVNRVGDTYFDQVERSGHASRPDDLERIANLGIRTLRYPVLWERTAPEQPGVYQWTWADDRLGRLRDLGLQPLVGLLHHGSGPRYTSLLDSRFPELFAQYAADVAARFPWVSSYTPINEPLTTARFSCLYGFWYPHARDAGAFVTATLAQCRATILAMRRIRECNPEARLVQTDDLGRTHGTRRLAYQVEFENERRWLGWDLLCGRVDSHHPLWGYLTANGASQADLEWFLGNATPPDVVGVNHYVTSERFLDHRVHRYPPEVRGGNGQDEYADVEAVRVLGGGLARHAGVLREAWERYRIPVALTEVQLSCSRAEQLRWFRDAWKQARDVEREGVEVVAVTAWSLLGAYDWSSLLTAATGDYEPGAFDLRAPIPRLTGLGKLIASASAGHVEEPPGVEGAGWWRRRDRVVYGHLSVGRRRNAMREPRASLLRRQPLLITGATGTLGSAFARVCRSWNLQYHLVDRAYLDIGDPAEVARVLDELEPWAVINAAGYVRVDDAERDRDPCFRANTAGPTNLALACGRKSIPLVTFSSDLVFDGRLERPYRESDEPAPLNVYGWSKWEAERAVLATSAKALVVRTSAFFGPWDAYNFATMGLRTLAGGGVWAADARGIVSPTYVPDLARACLDLLMDGETGLWHLANSGETSWLDFGRLVADRAGFSPDRVIPIELDDRPAERPPYSALASERGWLLPPWEDAVDRYVSEVSERRFRVHPERFAGRIDSADLPAALPAI